MVINLSPRFTRAYKNLPKHIQKDFKEKIQAFIKDPRSPSVKTHKLKGRLQSCLAFRLRDGYRVLFDFSAADTVNMLDVGPHDIYKRY